MRVLYVNHTAAVSGSERSMLTLLSALTGEAEQWLASPPGPLAQAAAELGVPVVPIASTAGSLRVHPLHTPRALAELARAALQVRRAARRKGVQIVHANSLRAGIETGLARVAPAAGVVFVRDCLPPGAITSATMRLVNATASVIVANSRYTAASVRAVVPAASVEVVHPGIDTRRFDPAVIDRQAARARLGAAGKRAMLLGVVAQLTPWKGQDTAVEALRELCSEGVDAHLLLVGSAKFVARSTRFDNRSYVERLHRMVAEGGLEDRVSFLGERDDVPQLVRALDALLLPSHEEPFGRALLEAMALEVPVLATNVGGPPELVRDGREGYLLAPREPRAWARAARRVAEDPAHARELGRAGRRRIVEQFSSERHAQAVLEVYARALSRETHRERPTAA